jgi:uncharacterized protein
MPVAVSYPGVYVQPLITPQPTAQGVATSITAFMGRAVMGPVNTCTQINSFADFERLFGGLAAGFPMSYAVNDFYNNGGGEALIIRLFEPLYTEAEFAQAQFVQADLEKIAEAQKTAKDANTKMSDEVSKQTKSGKFNPYQGQIGQNILAAFGPYAAGNPAATGPDLENAIENAMTSVVHESKATLQISMVNTVVSAATAVCTAATIAALGAPGDTNTVALAANTAAKQYTGPASQAAAGVISGAPGAKTNSAIPPGQMLAYQYWFALPGAVQTALQLSTNQAYHQAYADFQAATTIANAGVTAAVGPNATAALVLTAIQGAAAKNTSGNALIAARDVVEAAEASNNNGGSALDVAQAASAATTDILATDWPTNLTLVAADEGLWGNSLSAVVDTVGITASAATALGLTVSDLFNLTINYISASGRTRTESFRNVTVNKNGGTRRLDVVLNQQSDFVRMPVANGNVIWPAGPPDANASGSGSGGQDSNLLSMLTYLGDQLQKTGLYALEQVPLFNILCIPPDIADGPDNPGGGNTPNYVYQTAAEYCSARRAVLIIDPPTGWYDDYRQGNVASIKVSDLGSFAATAARSAAVYFPRMVNVDPLSSTGNQYVYPACGAIAGIWAATDSARGVWKAPAGLGAGINGIVGLQANLTDTENGLLNPLGINCLRTFPAGGTVVWGARTLQGADQLEDQYKYVSVQRTLLYIEHSLLQNTKWAIFEPNDETLWAELRLSVGVFMAGMFRQGAFPGASADQAYYVKCDATTTTQADIDAGIVNIVVGFAPLKPAEFVVITITQIAGQPSS